MSKQFRILGVSKTNSMPAVILPRNLWQYKNFKEYKLATKDHTTEVLHTCPYKDPSTAPPITEDDVNFDYESPNVCILTYSHLYLHLHLNFSLLLVDFIHISKFWHLVVTIDLRAWHWKTFVSG